MNKKVNKKEVIGSIHIIEHYIKHDVDEAHFVKDLDLLIALMCKWQRKIAEKEIVNEQR